MGMHGPLTAQALGRSPYDDVVEGEGEEDSRQPTQQYDNRGRPVNPETRRMNREIVRAHNEVMLVIGVAEAENTTSTPEPESQRRHEEYEESIGNILFTPSEQCIDAVGYLGLDGLRQRILSASSGTGRRPSIFSARADEYASDEEENEGVSATLISFDVEATDSSDAPPGLWSAELRPSAGTDSKSTASLLPVYLDTALTQLPVMAAGRTLGDALVRILTAPTEAIALRLVAHQFRWRIGYPGPRIYNINFSSQLSMTTFAVNFFATELLHLILCGEVWALFTGISQWYHRTDEQWQEEEEAKARGDTS
ncbi:hypothetical protein CDD80_5695 [Ophiocordyceps camponoti-rufipedis]|uniref:Uncharacterized protein n=1 Tax=Ophiocordyceps camponoti-rufipedis TaxID=2004952 RepID=A0A2C5ZI16_9HYPO|nr:hypothetical protein CDD80_5695 [Ophiocordyceps camponoti-rufipedis]